MSRLPIAISLACSVLVAAGCGSPEARQPQAGPVEGITWILTEINAYSAVPAPPGDQSAFIRMQNGKLTGYSGANDVSGTYTVDEAQLLFSNVTMSKRTGSPEVMRQEAGLTAALNHTILYRRSGDTLSLLDRQERILAKFKAVPPTP